MATPAINPDAPVPFALTPAADALVRPAAVTLNVAGVDYDTYCPAWCAEPHTQRYAALSDVLHRGRMETLAAPEGDGYCEVLVTEIAQWHGGQPFVSLDAPGDGATAELGPEAVVAFVDQAMAHLKVVRQQAATVAALRAASLHPRPAGSPAPPSAPKLPLPRREPGKSL